MAAASAFTFLSHVRALPLSISLFLHLSLHLGNHLLHPSQLCNTEQETCQGNDRRRTPGSLCFDEFLICTTTDLAGISEKQISGRVENLNKNSLISPQPPSPAGSYPCPFPPAPVPFCIDNTAY